MSLKDRVEAGVEKAFKRIDSLLLDATFTIKNPTSFNFASSTNVATESTVSIRGYRYDRTTKVDGQVVTKTQFMVKMRELPDTAYTTVVIAGVTYTCNLVSRGDFIVIYDLVRS
jgi:hypothetical protein